MPTQVLSAGRRHRYRSTGLGGVHSWRYRPPAVHPAARHERRPRRCRAVVDGERRRASVPRRWCRAAVSHMAAAVLVGPQATAGYAPCRNLPAGRHPIPSHHQPVRLPDFRRLYVRRASGEAARILNVLVRVTEPPAAPRGVALPRRNVHTVPGAGRPNGLPYGFPGFGEYPYAVKATVTEHTLHRGNDVSGSPPSNREDRRPGDAATVSVFRIFYLKSGQ